MYTSMCASASRSLCMCVFSLQSLSVFMLMFTFMSMFPFVSTPKLISMLMFA